MKEKVCQRDIRLKEQTKEHQISHRVICNKQGGKRKVSRQMLWSTHLSNYTQHTTQSRFKKTQSI